jgi:hypothetical protein
LGTPSIKLPAPGQNGLGRKGVSGERETGLGFQGLKVEGRLGCPGGVNHNDPVELRKNQGVLYVELVARFKGQVASGL